MKLVKHPILWVSAATVGIVLVLVFSFFSGRSMVSRYAPHMNAAQKVKLEATMAHLWFEEFISGDVSIDIDLVSGHIDQAEWYANVMLQGGEDAHSAFLPLRDSELIKQVEKTIEEIHAFRAIATLRWRQRSASGIGSDIDQEFDRVFRDLIAAADDVVVRQQNAMGRELRRFQIVQWGLIVFIGMAGLLIGWLLKKYEDRISHDIHELEESQDLLAQTQRLALIGSWHHDLANGVVQLSEQARIILGLESDASPFSFNSLLDRVHPDDRRSVDESYQQALKNGLPLDVTYRTESPDNRTKHINLHCNVIVDARGNALTAAGFLQDVTTQKESEEALRRAQKMDALGQLTGGIAHDFNNILGVIIGNTNLLRRRGSVDPAVDARTETIEKAARRAMLLTRQLLGFSRHQSSAITAVSLSRTISQMAELISRAVTPQIEVDYRLSSDLWFTMIDPGEFQDALLNLVINSRDAMDGRGYLVIEARNEFLDEEHCLRNPGTHPGKHVRLSIGDTGEGIPQKYRSRIFEPFFTTKSQGKGTGLGLSLVYAFVKRSKGHITLESQLRRGTTFHLYFPFTDRTPISEPAEPLEQEPKGHETILAVDDETDLLTVARETLEVLGYNVVTAPDGRQALRMIGDDPTIDLLFSDVVMPGGMNGFELAEQATRRRPDLRVLLTSGYIDRTVVNRNNNAFSSNVLSKPYSQVDLAQRVRRTLDRT